MIIPYRFLQPPWVSACTCLRFISAMALATPVKKRKVTTEPASSEKVPWHADYMSTKKPKTADEEELCLKTGDFLKKIRMRKKQPEVAVPDSSDGPTPAQQHIAVEPAGPSSAAQPPPVHEASPEKDEACSDDEHDLNTMEGCTNWMLCMFLPKNRAQLRHLAAFYLQNTLMPKVSKANPLFAEFTKTVVNGKLLHTKQSREMWIKATESNRSQRFAKVPKRRKAWALRRERAELKKHSASSFEEKGVTSFLGCTTVLATCKAILCCHFNTWNAY